MIRLLVFFIFSISVQLGSAQVILEHLTKKDGLPSNYTSGIIQDNDGYIWIATPKGAVRYDGKTMKTYTVDDGLTTNEIVGFFKDGIGRIWFNCFGGKSCYYYKGIIYNRWNDKRLNSLNLFEGNVYGSDTIITTNVILGFSKKFLWIKYHTSTLKVLSQILIPFKQDSIQFLSKIRISIKNSTNFSFDYDNFFSKNEQCMDQHIINAEKLIIKLFTDTVYIFDLRNNKLRGKFYFPGDIISPIIANDNSILFMSNDANRYYMYKNDSLYVSVTFNSQLRGLLFTGENNLWLSSDNGIYKVNFSLSQFSISEPIYSFFKFNDIIYAGSNEGNIFDLRTTNIRRINLTRIKGRTLDMTEMNGNLISIGDYGVLDWSKNQELNVIAEKRTIAAKNISKILDSAFISGPYGIISIKWNSSSIRYSRIYDRRSFNVKSIKNGSLIASTIDGLLIWRSDLQPYEKVKLPFNNIEVINHINEDKFQNLILSSNNGLIIESNKNYYLIDKSKGVLDNHINKTFTSADGKRLYVCTNKGFNVVDYRIENKRLFYNIKSYTTSDGLPSDEVNCALEDGNKVYVGTMEGLFTLPVKDTIRPFKIPILLESLLVNDSMLELKNKKWDYHQNTFQFNFSAFYYQRNKEMQFSYQLTPIDQLPVISDNPSIIYRGLAPGDYTLKVFAFDKHYPKLRKSKVWTYRFTISPPYYKTWWFISLMTLLAVSGGFLVYISYIRRKQRQNLEVQTLLKQMAQHRLEALKGQMNPHFIFNSLNTVQHFISSHNEREAMDFIAKFSSLIRKMLDLARVDKLSLEKEIQFLKDYAEIEQIRYAHKFDIEFIVEGDELDDIELPSMLVQPLLENAIKHGVSNLKERRGRIEVVIMTVDEHWLNIKIKDNGNGLVKREESSKSYTSAALDIIRERLAVYEIEGRKGKLDIQFSENGTVSELVVPI